MITFVTYVIYLHSHTCKEFRKHVQLAGWYAYVKISNSAEYFKRYIPAYSHVEQA
jgi:hypothetical protein